MKNNVVIKYLFLCLVFVQPVVLHGNNRRHIVILQDNSGSYYAKGNDAAISKVQTRILDLFNGELLNDDYNNLREERNNEIHFFNSEIDDISFFWFVASQADNLNFRDKTNGDYKFFEEYFLQSGAIPSLRGSNLDINTYLSRNFSERPLTNKTTHEYVDNMGTYSFTAYAYPCVFDRLNSDYTEEYIFIVISDFKAGSTFGNRKDEQIFRSAFRQKANRVIERVNWLNAQFYKIDYFDYYVNLSGDNLIGFTGFKTRPNCGLYTPENVSLKINSNITFEQLVFLGEGYEMQPSQIVFEHDKQLHVNKIVIEIDGISDKQCRKEIVDFDVDSTNMTYRIPMQNLTLEGFNGLSEGKKGLIRYVFQADYDLQDSLFVKYCFEVKRNINSDNFVFLEKFTLMQIIMITLVFLLILSLIFLIVRYLLLLGKPTEVIPYFIEYTERYETYDFSKVDGVHVLSHYKSWTEEDEKRSKFIIKVRGKLKYKSENNFLNWKKESGFPVRITPMELCVPNEFEAYVKCSDKTTNSLNTSVVFENAYSNREFYFEIVFYKRTNKEIDKPLRFSVKLKMVAINNGIRSLYCTGKMEYDFYLGPELGLTWIGLDPGTTGSCVAVGTSRNDITMEQSKDSADLITPSVVLIDADKMEKQSDDEIRKACEFGFGPEATTVNLIRNPNETRRKFVSIKKYLGYDFKIKLPKGNFYVTSSLLSSLLVENVLSQHCRWEYLMDKKFLDAENRYMPRRIAVAVPNNFTFHKIEQLRKCIEQITEEQFHKDIMPEHLKNEGGGDAPQFKEIRIIREAEALLVYHLNQYTSNISKQESATGECVLIFDMGGATINVTVATIRKTKNKAGDDEYIIKIISKLGYNIGGDTIDYALLKWIFSKTEEYKNNSYARYSFLNKVNPFNIMKEDVPEQKRAEVRARMIEWKLGCALDIKRITMDNVENKESHLFDTNTMIWQVFLNQLNENNKEIATTVDQGPIAKESLNDVKSFLYSPIFEKYIWSNIESIIKDITNICKEKEVDLDTVIMAGRSAHYPRVQGFVEKGITSAGYSPDFKLLPFDLSKSAVARGACYFGVQNKSITLENVSTNGAFGIIQTLSPLVKPDFHTLIKNGSFFSSGFVKKELKVTAQQDFSWDGNKVRFCQVMGGNPSEIIANDEKHKYSEVAVIAVRPYPVDKVMMEVTDKDAVRCVAIDSNGDIMDDVTSKVCDSDITACNDEQYTFFLHHS